VNPPKVSLVTPSYNLAPYLEPTLRSVLCQDYEHLEYLVLDACSTDGSGDILRRYEAALDVLIVEKDGGQSHALDRGFRLATGDILGYLNADDCLASAKVISQVVRCFAEHPTVDVVYGQRDYIDEHGGFILNYPYRPFCRRTLYLADYLPQEATFWRRRIYEAAGGCIDTSFDFAMDYELWLRFLGHGANFLSVPQRWGLFRWYPHQKSNAAWHTKGLPEIARLYDRHLGRRLSEEEMRNAFLEYYYLAHPVTQPAAYQFYFEAWSRMQQLGRTQYHGRPLDRWVERVELNQDRLDAMRWRRCRARAAAGDCPPLAIFAA
jgi:glycosyltransferase involved in cell wall biosynthesis